MDLTVGGSGFDKGSTVSLELGGVPASGIRTNSTTFVNPKQLVANVTISADAAPTQYDVAVTTSTGKRGIGVERFEVLPMLDLGLLDGVQTTEGDLINSQNHVLGMVTGSPFFWSPVGGLDAVQPGLWGIPYDMNDRDQLVGSTCGQPLPTDPSAPSCAYYGVLWQRGGSGWTTTRITGDRGVTYAINNLGEIFGDDPGPVRWTATGSGFTRAELPIPAGRTNPPVYDANDTGQAAGKDLLWSFEPNATVTVMVVPPPPRGSAPGIVALADVGASGDLVAVGSATIAGYVHPVRWTFRRSGGAWQTAKIEVLASPVRSFSGVARGVNNAGDAVGYVYGLNGVAEPVRWPVGAPAALLPHPKGGFHSRAWDINDQGWVTGTAAGHAVVWPRP